MRTRLYEVQDYLAENLSALPELSAARVALGYPAKMGKDEVWVAGEVADWQFDYRQSGLVSRDETFSITLNAFSSVTTSSYGKVRERVRAYTNAIEAFIAENPTLGGLAMLATVSSASLNEGISSDGRTRMILETLTLTVSAHVDAG